MFALEALTPPSSTETKDHDWKAGKSTSLLSSLTADFTSAVRNKENGPEFSREVFAAEAAVLPRQSIPSVIKSSSIIPETFIILFNIASIQYEHHDYSSCREILEKILSFLSCEPQDNGASIKVSFLLLEVLLRQWNNNPAFHTEEQLLIFKNQALETLATAEMYISLLYKLYPSPSDDNDNDNAYRGNYKISIPGTVDFKDLIGNLLRYKVNLFHARICMLCRLYLDAEKYISTAMRIFSDCIEPMLTASDAEINLTDSHGIQVVTSALSSYLGLISIELPVERNIVRQTLGELKREGLNTQVRSEPSVF